MTFILSVVIAFIIIYSFHLKDVWFVLGRVSAIKQGKGKVEETLGGNLVLTHPTGNEEIILGNYWVKLIRKKGYDPVYPQGATHVDKDGVYYHLLLQNEDGDIDAWKYVPGDKIQWVFKKKDIVNLKRLY